MRHLGIIVILLIVLLFSGCSSADKNATTSDSTMEVDAQTVGPSDNPNSSSQVVLSVKSTRWENPLQAPVGRHELRVDLQITVNSGVQSASLSPVLFSVQTDKMTIVLGTVRGNHPDGCTGDLAIAAGGHRTCSLTFFIPVGEIPQRIEYTMGVGLVFTTIIPVCSGANPGGLCQVPDRCEGACIPQFVRFDLRADGCRDCVLTYCGDEQSVCPSATFCPICPMQRMEDSDTNSCLESFHCADCVEAATTFWNCIISTCSTCIEKT